MADKIKLDAEIIREVSDDVKTVAGEVDENQSVIDKAKTDISSAFRGAGADDLEEALEMLSDYNATLHEKIDTLGTDLAKFADKVESTCADVEDIF